METIKGSIEIRDYTADTSDGIVVDTPDVSTLPAALTAIRGLSDFNEVDPVPTVERDVPSFVYRRVNDDEFVRELKVERANVPIADAMWTARKSNGAEVTVYFRADREVSADEMAASIALAQLQAQEG